MQRLAVALLCLSAIGFVPRASVAFPNDFELHRLGWPDASTTVNGRALEQDPFAQERFARFASDLALAIAPLPAIHASLGDAGFELTLSGDIAFVNPSQTFSDGQERAVWPTERQPMTGALFIPTLHLRKGLPFSLEAGASVGYLSFSQMVATTAQVKWALFEGFQWWPDVAVRAFATALVGSSPLTLVVGGWDAGMTYRFPLAGGAEGAVHLGFQQLGMNASTGNIDFDPGNEDPQNPSADDTVFREMPYGRVFSPATRFNRFYFGAQVRAGVLVVGLDAAHSSGDNPISEGAAVTARVEQWKMAARLGVTF